MSYPYKENALLDNSNVLPKDTPHFQLNGPSREIRIVYEPLIKMKEMYQRIEKSNLIKGDKHDC